LSEHRERRCRDQFLIYSTFVLFVMFYFSLQRQ